MKTAATRAAIKRASQQARNGMQQLDAKTVAALIALYTDAADEVRAAIRARVDASDMVPVGQLRDLMRQIEDVIDSLGVRRDALMQHGLESAAVLGARPYTLQGVGATGMAGHATLESAAAMRISQEAVHFVQNFAAADGLKLSDRVWRLNQGAKEVLTRSIGQAVVSGWDASRAAAQFMYDGKPVPIDVRQRLYAGKADALVRNADLLTGDGGEVWKADRVFRTEINRAHGTAYMAGAEKTPGFVGFRFLLSPRHPKPDICDLLASQNLHGLGAGVYPTAKACPWPAHPNTLSFVEMVFADEVTDADRAGKETPLQAMGRLSADVRDGVMGKTKATYFDQGLLGQGAIRSPLRAVEARLGRQGALPGQSGPHPDALQRYAEAVIPPNKLIGYALDSTHKTGSHKAIVFESALGFTQGNATLLEAQIRAGLSKVAAHQLQDSKHGQMFRADIPVTGPKGSAVVRTGWIIEHGGAGVPRLTTVYVK